MSRVTLTKGMPAEEINRAVEEITSRLTLREKIHFLSGNLINRFYLILDRFKYNYRPWTAGGSRRFGVPPVKFCDGPRGVVCGRSTCFPVAMARGASWDLNLEERVGEAIGREIRAHGGNYFGGVCINLLRHPAWGRAQETFGEDPYLLGEMGVALIRGVQKHNVMACVKHYAANSIENCRFWVDVRMEERTLREVYLPHFKRCIRTDMPTEGAASVMGAYNKFRGVHCCHNSYLLKDLLKQEWGFTGFVISDFFWGVKDTVEAANSGLDIEMPFTRFYGRKLRRAVRRGLVAKQTIDEAVQRIIRTVLQFTLAPDPQHYSKGLIACRRHRELAREAAEKSMVLLKNKAGLLPLEREKIRKLAVLGELATAPNTGDDGSSHVRPPYVVTILEGLRRYLSEETIIYCDGKDLKKAEETARTADAVIIVAGYRHNEEGEQVRNLQEKRKSKHPPAGGDRDSLALKDRDLLLINAAAPANKNCIIVLVSGSAVTMEEWKEKAAAILMAWYPGMEGGTALAKILFGEVNPSGKLPFTIPVRESDLPFFNDRTDMIEYGYYHGYTLFDRQGLKAAFPFGFGLSYTTFTYSNLRVESGNGRVTASFDLTNTGRQAGEETAQLYIGLEHSAARARVDRPVKLLRGFKKVFLTPGEKRTVTITVKHEDLAWYNPESKAWEVEDTDYTVYAGGSSRPEDLLPARFRLKP